MNLLQGKQPPATKESLAFNIGFTPKKNLRRLSKFMGKKHPSAGDGLSDTGKVRRLIKHFSKNKVEPSPVRSRVRSRLSHTKSEPVERCFSIRQQRHYSESDTLRRHALLNSSIDVHKSPSSPIFRSPSVKLFASEDNQWEMDL